MIARPALVFLFFPGLGFITALGATPEKNLRPDTPRAIISAQMTDAQGRNTAIRMSPPENATGGLPIFSPVKILENAEEIVMLFDGGILLADSSGTGLHTVKGVPPFTPLEASYTPNARDVLIVYQRAADGSGRLSPGAGVLSFSNQDTHWTELDIAGLKTIGRIQRVSFAEENNGPILLLDGTEASLRLDYNKILEAPSGGNIPTAPPPWYRTRWIFLGYLVGIALGGYVLMRIRERQNRHHHQILKKLVEIRTVDLTKASTAKDEFLASISHEIRNPMNGVIGLAESIKAESLDPDSQHKLGLLRQCATHLSSLLEDILDFSSIQAGADRTELKPFDLRDLMASVIALTAADSEKSGIPVEVAVSPAVPFQLIGDSRRIRQILLNFVGNALKYSNRGQVSVTVWRNQASAGFAEVFFGVSDDGPGILPEDQAKLFTRFERGTNAQLGHVPGTGLGLALCKALAEKMGGKVWVKSEIGQGSCFYFSANFAVPDQQTGAESPHEFTGGKKQSALVIDDEEYNRIALASLLETLDIDVQPAATDREALALASHYDFDLIFLDYSIPGLNGPAIARSIRGLHNRSAHAVIFATTAFNLPEQRAECLASGMNVFLAKPVTLERLRQALGATASVPAGATYSRSVPADPLSHLRLLATKKSVPFAKELRLYFCEFENELKQLEDAIQRKDPSHASYYAHLLYGRCSFIQERTLEHILRKAETAAITGCWDDARQINRDVQTKLADLRVRLFANIPAAPPV